MTYQFLEINVPRYSVADQEKEGLLRAVGEPGLPVLGFPGFSSPHSPPLSLLNKV